MRPVGRSGLDCGRLGRQGWDLTSVRACDQREQMPITQSDLLHWVSLQVNNLPGGSWRDPGGSWREARAPQVARLGPSVLPSAPFPVLSAREELQQGLRAQAPSGASSLLQAHAWASLLPEPRTVQGSCRIPSGNRGGGRHSTPHLGQALTQLRTTRMQFTVHPSVCVVCVGFPRVLVSPQPCSARGSLALSGWPSSLLFAIPY